MEHLGLWLYLAAFMDKIIAFFQLISISCIIYITIVWLSFDKEEIKGGILKRLKISAISCVVFFLLAIFLPSSKTIYLILGAKTVEGYIADTSYKAIELHNLKLDDELKNARTSK